MILFTHAMPSAFERLYCVHSVYVSRDVLVFFFPMSNPFTAFSFKEEEDEDLALCSTPERNRLPSKKRLSLSSNVGSGKRRKPEALAAADRDENLGSQERCLKEYKLIAEYRGKTKATVDDFHRFLLSLRNDQQGRYWALIACLLSVQCRDVVSLQAIRSLMATCPGKLC